MHTTSATDEHVGEPLVLLVEDNPDDVLLVRRALHKSALPVRLAVVSHGDAAVDYLAGLGDFVDRLVHPLPDVVLLDLKLPRRSGLEVLQWARAQPDLDALPIVVLTSSNEEDDLRRAYHHRANSYLRKPVTFTALSALLTMFHQYWLGLNTTPMSAKAAP